MNSFLTEEIQKGTDWRAVERAIARLMSHCGWRDVHVIGRSGDAGGDVLATRREGERDVAYVVQVKAVTSDNYVGQNAIREAINALSTYHADVAVVATNGDFTNSALMRRDELKAEGFNIKLWNGQFLQNLLAGWFDQAADRRELRPYQLETVERCLELYHSGGRRAKFVVATGLGKTVIAAELLSRLAESGLQRFLVLCHSQDLALQLERSFWAGLSRTMPTRVFFDGSPPKPYNGVNFGLYQTFTNYLGGIDPSDYEAVIVDEAHHALAQGFSRCLNHLRPRFMVGMTATPWRGDGRDIDSLFGPSLAQISLVDGMKMGYLARVDYRIYCDTLDWEKVSSDTAGQVSIQRLNKRIFVPQRDEAIIDEVIEQCRTLENPRIIFFCASVEHGHRFATLFSQRSSISCKPLSGVERLERERTLMDFAVGKIKAVTAVDVLNEGIDVPEVNILVFLRSTHSRRIFVQQLGRGLRLAPDKEKLLVLDFVTDIRRLAEVIEMDRQARKPERKFQNVYFDNGIVTFVNQGDGPFVQQWLEDVTDLSDQEDEHLLTFPAV